MHRFDVGIAGFLPRLEKSRHLLLIPSKSAAGVVLTQHHNIFGALIIYLRIRHRHQKLTDKSNTDPFTSTCIYCLSRQ